MGHDERCKNLFSGSDGSDCRRYYLCHYKNAAYTPYASVFAVLTVLASGALGNFIDRLTLGYVRDFIYFKLINFPIFNVADIYVTVSVVCFAILILFIIKKMILAFKENRYK